MHSFKGYTCPDQGATLSFRVDGSGNSSGSQGDGERVRHEAEERCGGSSATGSVSGGRDRVYAQTVSNEAVADPSASRLAGVVGGVDRVFPLLWIGIYLVLPVSGWAAEMFATWFDQRRDLGALQQLLADGRADAIADNVIGPGYIGAAALVHDVLRLSAEDSLIALTRASYALSIALGLVLVRVLVARLTHAQAVVSLSSQLVFVGFVFAAGTWYWSDVPWSHFFAAFLAVAVYAVRFTPSARSVLWAAATGSLLALLAATRSFELVAVVLAWLLVALGLRLVRLDEWAWNARRALSGVAAFVVTTGIVYLATGKREPFFLYENHLDRQSGSVPQADVAETPTLSLSLLPVKLVQLVVDPCYLSLCETSDYETGGGGGQNVDLWSLPLAIQLPALLLLPLCIVGVGVLVVRHARRGATAHGTALRSLAEMTLAATGLVVGYAGSTLTGPSHLRYGFARDFLLPALLTTIVAVALGSAACWRLLARRRSSARISSEAAYVVAAFGVLVGVVASTTVARVSGLPRIEGKHLGAVLYSARCAGQTCDVRVDATTKGGDPVSIPDSSTLTFGCGNQRVRLTVYVSELGDVDVAPTCADPRLVSAWPTVMGLPPGSFELGAVDVRNV